MANKQNIADKELAQKQWGICMEYKNKYMYMLFASGLGLILIVVGILLIEQDLGIRLALITLGIVITLANLMLALFFNLRLHFGLLYKQILSLQAAVALTRVPLRRPVFFLRHAVAPDFIELLAELIRRTKVRSVLEMGSGASTLYLASLLPNEQEGGSLVCLESDMTWVSIVNAELQTIAPLERASVRVIYAPIATKKGTKTTYYSWGDELQNNSGFFDLAVIDGPSDVNLRGGVFEYCMSYLTEKAILIFDDGDQVAIKSMVSQWVVDNPQWGARYYPTVKGTWILYNLSQHPMLFLP